MSTTPVNGNFGTDPGREVYTKLYNMGFVLKDSISFEDITRVLDDGKISFEELRSLLGGTQRDKLTKQAFDYLFGKDKPGQVAHVDSIQEMDKALLSLEGIARSRGLSKPEDVYSLTDFSEKIPKPSLDRLLEMTNDLVKAVNNDELSGYEKKEVHTSLEKAFNSYNAGELKEAQLTSGNSAYDTIKELLDDTRASLPEKNAAEMADMFGVAEQDLIDYDKAVQNTKAEYAAQASRDISVYFNSLYKDSKSAAVEAFGRALLKSVGEAMYTQVLNTIPMNKLFDMTLDEWAELRLNKELYAVIVGAKIKAAREVLTPEQYGQMETDLLGEQGGDFAEVMESRVRSMIAADARLSKIQAALYGSPAFLRRELFAPAIARFREKLESGIAFSTAADKRAFALDKSNALSFLPGISEISFGVDVLMPEGDKEKLRGSVREAFNQMAQDDPDIFEVKGDELYIKDLIPGRTIKFKLEFMRFGGVHIDKNTDYLPLDEEGAEIQNMLRELGAIGSVPVRDTYHSENTQGADYKHSLTPLIPHTPGLYDRATQNALADIDKDLHKKSDEDKLDGRLYTDESKMEINRPLADEVRKRWMEAKGLTDKISAKHGGQSYYVKRLEEGGFEAFKGEVSLGTFNGDNADGLSATDEEKAVLLALAGRYSATGAQSSGRADSAAEYLMMIPIDLLPHLNRDYANAPLLTAASGEIKQDDNRLLSLAQLLKGTLKKDSTTEYYLKGPLENILAPENIERLYSAIVAFYNDYSDDLALRQNGFIGFRERDAAQFIANATIERRNNFGGKEGDIEYRLDYSEETGKYTVTIKAAGAEKKIEVADEADLEQAEAFNSLDFAQKSSIRAIFNRFKSGVESKDDIYHDYRRVKSMEVLEDQNSSAQQRRAALQIMSESLKYEINRHEKELEELKGNTVWAERSKALEEVLASRKGLLQYCEDLKDKDLSKSVNMFMRDIKIDGIFVSLLEQSHEASKLAVSGRSLKSMLQNTEFGVNAAEKHPETDIVMLALEAAKGTGRITEEDYGSLRSAFLTGQNIEGIKIRALILAVRGMHNMEPQEIAGYANKVSEKAGYFADVQVLGAAMVAGTAGSGEPVSADGSGTVEQFNDAAGLARKNPFASLKMRVNTLMHMGTGDPVQEMVLTDNMSRQDLVDLENYIRQDARDPEEYVHWQMDQSDLAVLKGIKESSSAVPELTELFDALAAQGTKNPEDSKTARVNMTVEQKKALDEMAQDPSLSARARSLLQKISFSYYSDSAGLSEDADRIKELRLWMEENNIAVLDSAKDLFEARELELTEKNNAYYEGRNVLSRYARASQVMPNLPMQISGVERSGTGYFTSLPTDLLKRMFAMYYQPMGVEGADTAKLMRLKMIYLEQNGSVLMDEFRQSKTQMEELGNEIENIIDEASSAAEDDSKKLEARLKNRLDELDILERKIQVLSKGLTRIDKQFYDWLVDRFVDDSSAWDILAKFFNEQVGMTKPLFIPGEGPVDFRQVLRDPSEEFVRLLEGTGADLSPEKGCAKEKIALSFLLGAIPAETTSETINAPHPESDTAMMIMKNMALGGLPEEDFGMLMKGVLVNNFRGEPVKLAGIMERIHSLKPQQVDRELVALMAELVKAVAPLKENDEYYKSLKKLADNMEGRTVDFSTGNFKDPECRTLFYGLFNGLLYRELGEYSQPAQHVSVVKGGRESTGKLEGQSAADRFLSLFDGNLNDVRGRWDRMTDVDLTKMMADIGLVDWESQDSFNKALRAVGLVGNMAYTIPKTFFYFGPVMQTSIYFGLPISTGRKIFDAFSGEYQMKIDRDNRPILDENGQMQLEPVTFTDAGKALLDTIGSIYMFRKIPGLVFLSQPLQQLEEGNYTQAVFDFWVVNFLMSQKDSDGESGWYKTLANGGLRGVAQTYQNVSRKLGHHQFSGAVNEIAEKGAGLALADWAGEKTFGVKVSSGETWKNFCENHPRSSLGISMTANPFFASLERSSGLMNRAAENAIDRKVQEAAMGYAKFVQGSARLFTDTLGPRVQAGKAVTRAQAALVSAKDAAAVWFGNGKHGLNSEQRRAYTQYRTAQRQMNGSFARQPLADIWVSEEDNMRSSGTPEALKMVENLRIAPAYEIEINGRMRTVPVSSVAVDETADRQRVTAEIVKPAPGAPDELITLRIVVNRDYIERNIEGGAVKNEAVIEINRALDSMQDRLRSEQFGMPSGMIRRAEGVVLSQKEVTDMLAARNIKADDNAARVLHTMDDLALERFFEHLKIYPPTGNNGNVTQSDIERFFLSDTVLKGQNVSDNLDYRAMFDEVVKQFYDYKYQGDDAKGIKTDFVLKNEYNGAFTDNKDGTVQINPVGKETIEKMLLTAVKEGKVTISGMSATADDNAIKSNSQFIGMAGEIEGLLRNYHERYLFAEKAIGIKEIGTNGEVIILGSATKEKLAGLANEIGNKLKSETDQGKKYDLSAQLMAVNRELLSRAKGLDGKPRGYYAHKGQVMLCFNDTAPSKDVYLNMGTGEGKSDATYLAAAMRALQGEPVLLVVSDRGKKEKGYKEAQDYFRTLGLTSKELGQNTELTGALKKNNIIICSHEYLFGLANALEDRGNAEATKAFDLIKDRYGVFDESDLVRVQGGAQPVILIAGSLEEAKDAGIWRRANSAVETFLSEKGITADNVQTSGAAKKFFSVSEDKQVNFNQEFSKWLEGSNFKGIVEGPNSANWHKLKRCMEARLFFEEGKNYRNYLGEVVLTGEHTGRLLYGYQLEGGIMQAIQAKEGTRISRTSHRMSAVVPEHMIRQFRGTLNLSGTNDEEASFFRYNHGFVNGIQSILPETRVVPPALMYRTQEQSRTAIVDLVNADYKNGQGNPQLVCVSSEKEARAIYGSLRTKLGSTENLMLILDKEILLNGKPVIAEKGKTVEETAIDIAKRKGVVAVATIAGRGTDIKVKMEGGVQGLIVTIGDVAAAKVQMQEIGRSGRISESQGIRTPGVSRIIASLESEYMRTHLGENGVRTLEAMLLPNGKDMAVVGRWTVPDTGDNKEFFNYRPEGASKSIGETIKDLEKEQNERYKTVLHIDEEDLKVQNSENERLLKDVLAKIDRLTSLNTRDQHEGLGRTYSPDIERVEFIGRTEFTGQDGAKKLDSYAREAINGAVDEIFARIGKNGHETLTAANLAAFKKEFRRAFKETVVGTGGIGIDVSKLEGFSVWQAREAIAKQLTDSLDQTAFQNEGVRKEMTAYIQHQVLPEESRNFIRDLEALNLDLERKGYLASEHPEVFEQEKERLMEAYRRRIYLRSLAGPELRPLAKKYTTSDGETESKPSKWVNASSPLRTLMGMRSGKMVDVDSKDLTAPVGDISANGNPTQAQKTAFVSQVRASLNSMKKDLTTVVKVGHKEYDLSNSNKVSELNTDLRKCSAEGSAEHYQIAVSSRGPVGGIDFIFGTATIEDITGQRTVTFTKEEVYTSLDVLGYTRYQPSSVFGETKSGEIVLRPFAIVHQMRRMAQAAFSDTSNDEARAQLNQLKEVFEECGIRDAAQAGVKPGERLDVDLRLPEDKGSPQGKFIGLLTKMVRGHEESHLQSDIPKPFGLEYSAYNRFAPQRELSEMMARYAGGLLAIQNESDEAVKAQLRTIYLAELKLETRGLPSTEPRVVMLKEIERRIVNDLSAANVNGVVSYVRGEIAKAADTINEGLDRYYGLTNGETVLSQEIATKANGQSDDKKIGEAIEALNKKIQAGQNSETERTNAVSLVAAKMQDLRSQILNERSSLNGDPNGDYSKLDKLQSDYLRAHGVYCALTGRESVDGMFDLMSEMSRQVIGTEKNPAATAFGKISHALAASDEPKIQIEEDGKFNVTANGQKLAGRDAVMFMHISGGEEKMKSLTASIVTKLSEASDKPAFLKKVDAQLDRQQKGLLVNVVMDAAEVKTGNERVNVLAAVPEVYRAQILPMIAKLKESDNQIDVKQLHGNVVKAIAGGSAKTQDLYRIFCATGGDGDDRAAWLETLKTADPNNALVKNGGILADYEAARDVTALYRSWQKNGSGKNWGEVLRTIAPEITPEQERAVTLAAQKAHRGPVSDFLHRQVFGGDKQAIAMSEEDATKFGLSPIKAEKGSAAQEQTKSEQAGTKTTDDAGAEKNAAGDVPKETAAPPKVQEQSSPKPVSQPVTRQAAMDSTAVIGKKPAAKGQGVGSTARGAFGGGLGAGAGMAWLRNPNASYSELASAGVWAGAQGALDEIALQHIANRGRWLRPSTMQEFNRASAASHIRTTGLFYLKGMPLLMGTGYLIGVAKGYQSYGSELGDENEAIRNYYYRKIFFDTAVGEGTANMAYEVGVIGLSFIAQNNPWIAAAVTAARPVANSAIGIWAINTANEYITKPLIETMIAYADLDEKSAAKAMAIEFAKEGMPKIEESEVVNRSGANEALIDNYMKHNNFPYLTLLLRSYYKDAFSEKGLKNINFKNCSSAFFSQAAANSILLMAAELTEEEKSAGLVAEVELVKFNERSVDFAIRLKDQDGNTLNSMKRDLNVPVIPLNNDASKALKDMNVNFERTRNLRTSVADSKELEAINKPLDKRERQTLLLHLEGRSEDGLTKGFREHLKNGRISVIKADQHVRLDQSLFMDIISAVEDVRLAEGVDESGSYVFDNTTRNVAVDISFDEMIDGPMGRRDARLVVSLDVYKNDGKIYKVNRYAYRQVKGALQPGEIDKGVVSKTGDIAITAAIGRFSLKALGPAADKVLSGLLSLSGGSRLKLLQPLGRFAPGFSNGLISKMGMTNPLFLAVMAGIIGKKEINEIYKQLELTEEISKVNDKVFADADQNRRIQIARSGWVKPGEAADNAGRELPPDLEWRFMVEAHMLSGDISERENSEIRRYLEKTGPKPNIRLSAEGRRIFDKLRRGFGNAYSLRGIERRLAAIREDSEHAAEMDREIPIWKKQMVRDVLFYMESYDVEFEEAVEMIEKSKKINENCAYYHIKNEYPRFYAAALSWIKDAGKEGAKELVKEIKMEEFETLRALIVRQMKSEYRLKYPAANQNAIDYYIGSKEVQDDIAIIEEEYKKRIESDSFIPLTGVLGSIMGNADFSATAALSPQDEIARLHLGIN